MSNARTMTTNDRGEYVPAIPLPMYLSRRRMQCKCGEIRKGSKSYREHFAYSHILGMSA